MQIKKYHFYTALFLGLVFSASGSANANVEAEKMPNSIEMQDYTLKKVVIFSRHGIRAPLIGFGSALAEATPDSWPVWQTKGGHLTAKGARLEEVFARYFSRWFNQTGLLTANSCPQNEVLIYTNSLPRTIDTGKHFAKSAFPNCFTPVYHLEKVGVMDNTFNPIIRSKVDETFIKKATKSIDNSLGEGGFAQLNQRLADNFRTLEIVLNYAQSKTCQGKIVCDLIQQPNTLTFAQGKEAKTTGSLRNGTGAADSFILQYYEGFPTEQVAWGRIKNAEMWRQISAIKDTYNDVLFASPVIAKEAATPLLTFIQNSFFDLGYPHPLIKQAQQAKLVLLVGHDSNVGSLLSLLKVKKYHLPEQFERTPISGKIAFQLWQDKTGQDWIKIDYIYQSTEQLRSGKELNGDNLPHRVSLTMQDCPTNKEGLCKLDDFAQAMIKALQ